MRVTFDPRARDDLDGIFYWIASDSPRAAMAMVERIETQVMRLAVPGLAHIGRPGFVAGTRELIEWPFIIVYRVHEERSEIVVVSVVHGARDRSGT
jgi:toxin ParE1/3/4